jgi:hypothetical protein
MDTKVEQVKRLEEQLAAARESARAAFLTAIAETLEQLRGIGFAYEVRPNGAANTGQTCSVCGQPGHSKRTCPRKGEAK